MKILGATGLGGLIIKTVGAAVLGGF